MPEKQLLDCTDCGKPVAHLHGGVLVIKSRHHGQQHVTSFAVLDLVEIAYGEPMRRFVEQLARQTTKV